MCCSEQQHEQSPFTEYMLVLTCNLSAGLTFHFFNRQDLYTKNNTHMTGMSAAKLLWEHGGHKRQ